MIFRSAPAAFAALFLATACFFTTESGSKKNDPEAAGMRFLKAEGKQFQQGSDKELGNLDERPVVTNGFTYGFFIDTAEVTQSQFLKMMGRSPVPESSPYGVGYTYPVYNVTWYDAVLFCNARSKS